MSLEDGVCTDCGSEPIHRDSEYSYCRRCGEKADYSAWYKTEVDHDKLRALVGDETAARIIAECEAEP